MAVTSHKYNNFVVFDYETGGLDCRKNAAVEIGCLLVDGNTLEFKETYTAIFKPYSEEFSYEPAAMKVHGLTMNDLHEKGKPISEIIKDLNEFFKLAAPFKAQKYKPILVAHNSSFDSGFLEQNYQFTDSDFSSVIQTVKDCKGIYHPRTIDTMDTCRRMLNHLPDATSFSLGKVCEYLGIELNGAHRSMADVFATAELFRMEVLRARSLGKVDSVALEESRFRKKFQLQF